LSLTENVINSLVDLSGNPCRADRSPS